MAEILLKLLNLLRPREGWLPFLLVLAALLSLPAALFNSGDGTGAPLLALLTILAAILGLRLARSSISARAAALLGGLLGVGLAIVSIGQLVPPLSLLWSEVGHSLSWFTHWRQGQLDWPLPLASVAEFVWQRASTLSTRFWWWGQTVASGGQAQDRIVLFLLTSLLAWVFAFFAAWQIYRHRSALIGLLPSGLAIASVAFFQSGLATFYLIVYLFSALWLVAICHLWTNRERWEQSGTDFPGSLGVELTISFGPLLVLIISLAALVPVAYSNPVREAFWRLMDAPWSRVERAAEQVFGPIDSGDFGATGARPGSGGTLPQAHLLRGRPELGETIVFFVRTDDPPPPRPDPDQMAETEPGTPHRYWRGTTYDTYTGRGWINGPLESTPITPNRSLQAELPAGTDLLQQFQLVIQGGGQRYSVNTPHRLDSPGQAWWRGPGDLAYLTGDAKAYTVLSRVAEPTIAALRAGSPLTSTLPAEVAERYLALPDSVPQRVLDLAREVVGESATRYDQAKALERYLRTYPYTLDLPEPPGDRDLVDYFLFEHQEGYCDYYASAMVVMARAVGVPARLASGYAQGTYDHDTGKWVVTEKDGHSWVEVFFDGIGWVEFEPTAGLPALERPGAEDWTSIAIPPLPPRATTWWQRVPWGLVVLGGLMLLLAMAVAWIWHPRPAIAGADLIRDRQARLLRWGTRLGYPFREGQTPHEYSQTLGQSLHDRAQKARLSQVRQAGAEAPAQIEELAAAFVRTQYSPRPVTDREGWQIRDLWVRLRRWLRWLWLAPRWHGGRHDEEGEQR